MLTELDRPLTASDTLGMIRDIPGLPTYYLNDEEISHELYVELFDQWYALMVQWAKEHPDYADESSPQSSPAV